MPLCLWEIICEIARGGKPALGLEQIQQQQPTDRPQEPKFSPRFKFLCFDEERLEELLDGYRQFNGGYKEIFDAYRTAARKGRRKTVEWPYGSYPPSCHRPMTQRQAA